MCEIFSCISLSFVDSIISVLILALNGVYVVWGWIAPNSDDRETLEHYIQSLKSYQNFVTYSDSVLLFSKIFMLILLRYVCCAGKHCNADTHADTNTDISADKSHENKGKLSNVLQMFTHKNVVIREV